MFLPPTGSILAKLSFLMKILLQKEKLQMMLVEKTFEIDHDVRVDISTNSQDAVFSAKKLVLIKASWTILNLLFSFKILRFLLLASLNKGSHLEACRSENPIIC